MAEVLISPRALIDLERLADFLHDSDPRAAGATAGIILDGLSVLERHPLVGRPAEQGLRELVISRGRSGYLALYDYDPPADRVIVLAIRHAREAGYAED